jgi:serine/threonine protein kinase
MRSLPPHPNIVRYIGSRTVEDDKLGMTDYDILMECCSGGSALDELQAFAGRHTPLAEARVLRRWRDMVAGVAHLHAHRIVHRDIKVENLLLASLYGVGASAGGSSSSSGGGGSAAAADKDVSGAHFTGKLCDFGSASIDLTMLVRACIRFIENTTNLCHLYGRTPRRPSSARRA